MNLENIIWRVLQNVPGEDFVYPIYSGRGEEARQKAEKIYNTVIRDTGRIGLYKGIYPIKTREADIIK